MALTTPKMGLRTWNLPGDPYDHNQLTDNFAKVDYHDHTLGRGVQLTTASIANGAITKALLDPSIGLIANTGTIILAGTNVAPSSGFLLCNGASVSRTTYSALFAYLGTTWGAGDGTTTFGLPNIPPIQSYATYFIKT